MERKNKLKYFLRFSFLQIFLTTLTILFFDTFLIGDYEDGYDIIIRNLLEDRDRFYPIVPNQLIKIDIYLSIFIFLFLVLLYSSKFYSMVNELSFTIDKGILDEFFPIYLIWSASFVSFLQIFRFTAISRGYLLLYTFIVPLILVLFRNSEFISSLLGRNITNENFVTFNLEKDSIFNELRLLKFRNNIMNFRLNDENDFSEIIKSIDKLNKKEKINLIVFNFDNLSKLNNDFEEYLLNINKKVLLISTKNIQFKNKFYFRLSQINNKNLIYLNNDVQYGSSYILKRVLDIFVSIISLILLSPFILYSAIYILIKDGRPVLFKQTRVGLHGNNFKMYKFRTMLKDSHGKRSELDKFNTKSGPLFKIQDDPRLIPGINFIRNFSIDEIPQFINVLKGEMSVVGPRPLFPEDNQHYATNYIRRLNVLPGVTGLLQINERNTDDFDIWYKYDIEYIDNWSLYLDLKIILKTPLSLFNQMNKGI